MEITKPEKFENEVLNEINDILDIEILKRNTTSEFTEIKKFCEMSFLERCFLNGIIRQSKPIKILELGVAAGGSSAIILNAIKDFDNAKLYSVDYNKKLYYDNSKDIGFIIDEKFSHLKDKWKLYTGGTAAKFMEEIGSEIDLCLIDTMHVNPGEFLDFLIVLPYLKKNAILILHDICLHQVHRNAVTNCILFSCLKGKKFIFNEGFYSKFCNGIAINSLINKRQTLDKGFGNEFSNIGAVILDKDIKDNILDYIFLLTLPWEYLLSDIDILQCHKLFLKNYGKEIAEIFLGIIFLNKELFIKNKNAEISNINNNVYNEINSIKIKYDNLEKDLSDIINSYKNLINTMAWWIPVRKWRDNFRNKFFDKFIGGG